MVTTRISDIAVLHKKKAIILTQWPKSKSVTHGMVFYFISRESSILLHTKWIKHRHCFRPLHETRYLRTKKKQTKNQKTKQSILRCCITLEKKVLSENDVIFWHYLLIIQINDKNIDQYYCARHVDLYSAKNSGLFWLCFKKTHNCLTTFRFHKKFFSWKYSQSWVELFSF